MKVTFLGTGTSQGVPVIACSCNVCQSTDSKDKRLRASVLVEVDGLNIVIDAGPDFRQQMLRVGVKRLDAILVTHEHYDHIAGLDDIRAFNWVEKRPTPIYVEQHAFDAIRNMFGYVFAKEKYPGIPQMAVNIIDEQPFFIQSTKILPIRAMHYKLPILGFRIGDFVYLTDVKVLPDSERWKVRGAKYLVINALRRQEHLSHLTLNEAIEIVRDVKPEQAFLTHIGHQLGKHAEEEKLLPQGIHFAYDNLTLEL